MYLEIKYLFLFKYLFTKNISNNTGKNISRNLTGKCNPGMLGEGQKLLDDAKISDADEFKTTTNIGIQKTTEATGD